MGWYRFGPTPGAESGGSVVIAGHLDSKRFGLGPLARLRDVEVGQPIEVTLADGATSTYTVVGVERFDFYDKARTAYAESRLYAPAGDNAMEYYLALRDKADKPDVSAESALIDERMRRELPVEPEPVERAIEGVGSIVSGAAVRAP